MEGRRKPSSLAEGLRNTEIKRETDIRNSLGPQQESGRADRGEQKTRDTDAVGRGIPGKGEE